MRRLFVTEDSWLLMVQRLILGLVMFPHGAQKLLGWFGGHGFHGTIGFFTNTLHVPALFAFLVIVAEFFGSLGLILGFLTRIAAFGISAVMVGAIFLAHIPNGFFMNWTGNQGGEGFEFHLLALALSIPLIIKGAGLGSVDRALANQLSRKSVPMTPHPSHS